MEKYDHSKTEIAKIGEKLIQLGSALKDPDTRISELAELSHAAGLHIFFDIQDVGPAT